MNSLWHTILNSSMRIPRLGQKNCLGFDSYHENGDSGIRGTGRVARDAFILSSLPFSTSDGSDGSKNLCPALILPTHHSQFKLQRNFDDEPRGPRQSTRFRWAHIASSSPDTHPHLRSRSATRSCPLAEDLSLRILSSSANSQ